MNKDTDWKSKLEEAKKIANAAFDDLKIANAKFEGEMSKAKYYADLAIECGGADAEKQWLEFRDNLVEGLENLVDSIDKAIHEFSEKIDWVANRYWIITALAIIIGVAIYLFTA